MVAKRAAADALVYGVNGADGEAGTADDIPAANVPEDSYAFLNSAPHEVTDPVTGVTTVVNTTWVDPANTTNTGVDRIDLWVGGLAEKQHVFGGLLGPTFNYVFEAQMEDLQFGDRFYYLSRTAGLNLLTQLEGNSFAELIQRNTDVERPAGRLVLAAGVRLRPGQPGHVRCRPRRPGDGPTTSRPCSPGCRTARSGTAARSTSSSTAPAGNNRVWSSEGDDTIRGNDGNDWMQGGDGNDNHIGGLGDDILLDTNGDDTLKGGDGNDTLSSGQGFGGDLNQGGRGNDFIDPRQRHGRVVRRTRRRLGPRRRRRRHGLRRRRRRLDRERCQRQRHRWWRVQPAAGRQRRSVPGRPERARSRRPDRLRRRDRLRREGGDDVMLTGLGSSAARACSGSTSPRTTATRRRRTPTWTSQVCSRRASRRTRTGSTSSRRCPGGTWTTSCGVTTVTPQRWWATSSTAAGRPAWPVSAPSWVAPPRSPAATSSWVVPAPT